MQIHATPSVSFPSTPLSQAARVLLCAAIALAAFAPSVHAQGGVTIASAPIGTTNNANPEIQVVAPGRVAYRYSLNGGPYSPEQPIGTPIRFAGTVTLGGRQFMAGTRALAEFLALKGTDQAFSEFLGTIAFDHVESQLQVTYALNKMRTSVEPENILNLRGSGVGAFQVTLQEKVPTGVRFELTALAVSGGELSRQPGAAPRHFVLSLPQAAQSMTLTPEANNPQTTILVNGQPALSGQAVAIPAPPEGSSVTVQAIAPDGGQTAYTLVVHYDGALAATEYRSFYLRAFTPAAAYVSLHNAGAAVVDFGLTFNQKFGLDTPGIIREILEMAPEYAGESIPRKVWRFIKANRYHFEPITSSNWYHAPALFFNSAGFGYCDDSASVFRHLITAMGYPARVWLLNGHVVAEVFNNNRWEMWDPDLEVYYLNHQGLVSGVEELAADPGLITNPVSPLPNIEWPYSQVVADIYGTQGDNSVVQWYSDLPIADPSMTLQVPPGATFEFPDIFDSPLSAIYQTAVPTYTNARLIVPAGFTGSVTMPLIIQSVGWSNQPRLIVSTRDASGNWDAQPAVASWIVDCDPPFTMPAQPSGAFNSEEPVTLTTTEAATIHYTTDGTTPTEASPVYIAPFTIPLGGVLKFFGVDAIGNTERVRIYGPEVRQVRLQLSSMTGTTATFSTTASGGSGSYEYKFLLRDTLNAWSTVQHYGGLSTWTWNKTNVAPGLYTVRVWVRNAGALVEYDRWTELTLTVSPEAAPILVNPGDQVNDDAQRTYAEAVSSDTPVAYWRLGETAGTIVADSVGASPGARLGGVSIGQPGGLAVGGGAMLFNGSNGYLRVADSAALHLSGNLTIEMWLNVSLTARQTLISKSYLHEFELTLETDGRLNLYQGNGATYTGVLSTDGAVSANTWQHVVVTRSAATRTIDFYVNGVSKGTGSYVPVPVASGYAVSIGRSEGGGQYVNGRLAEVAVYAAVLSPVQIAKHYAMRSANGSGAAVELPLVATDSDGDALTYGVSGLPPGLTINASTGFISGRLSREGAGVYPVIATVSDGTLSHSQPFLWTVTHVNRVPVLAVPGAQTHAEGSTIGLQLWATDADGDALVFGAAGLPSSLTLDSSSGLISGTLPFGSAGVYQVTASVSDGSLTSIGTFVWTVTHTNRAPVLSSPGPRTVGGYADGVLADGPVAYWRLGDASGTTAADTAGAHAATVIGATLGQPGALADGSPSARLNGTSSHLRVASGATLPLAGDLTIELWVNMSLGTRQTLVSKDYLREFELTVETSGHLNFYQGNGLVYEAIASIGGAVAADSWQHVVVARSAATKTIRFYVNGLAKGSGTYQTAPTAGTKGIVIGRSDNYPGVRYVNGRMDEVALYPVTLSAAQVATHYAARNLNGSVAPVVLQLSAIDPDGDAITYGAIGLPASLALNSATGLVSGTLSAADAGVYVVTARASDNSLLTEQSFTWTVALGNRAPALTVPGNLSSTEGGLVSLQLSGSDPDGDALTYSVAGLPGSLSVDPATGIVAGTLSFSSAGTFNVTATVSDGRLSASQAFTLTVANINRAPGLAAPGAQLSAAQPDYATGVLADAPVAYWRLGDSGGSVADSVAFNTGVVVGGVATAQSGALTDNSAMLFDGSTGFIRVPGASTLPLAGDLTIELWVNLSLAARQTLISKHYLHEFELSVETSGHLTFYQGNGMTYEGFASQGGAIAAHTWQHVVVTRNTTTKTIRFYVNGIEKGSSAYATAPTAGLKGVVIARSDNYPGVRYVNGTLDDIALYRTALSPTQVQAHHLRRAGTANAVALQLSAADPDGDGLTFSVTGLPPQLTINPTTGLISGTLSPSSAGTYQVTVTVSDGQLTAAQSFTWTVGPAQ